MLFDQPYWSILEAHLSILIKWFPYIKDPQLSEFTCIILSFPSMSQSHKWFFKYWRILKKWGTNVGPVNYHCLNIKRISASRHWLASKQSCLINIKQMCWLTCISCNNLYSLAYWIQWPFSFHSTLTLPCEIYSLCKL